ncbi:MAG: histidinol-phosphatase [Hyphomicrobiales bacterium]
MNFNLHSHSHYSDGKLSIEDHVTTAIDLGFHTIGFSDHSPLPFAAYFAMDADKIGNYSDEILAMKEKYKEKINIYLSMEMDYIPNVSYDFNSWDVNFDYLIGSVHLVGKKQDQLWFIDGPKQETYDEGLVNFYDNDIKKAVKAYYTQVQEMIDTQRFNIVGHLDKIRMHNNGRYFNEDEQWYLKLVDDTLDLIKEKNLLMEVNTRGIYKKRSTDVFPNYAVLQKASAIGIPVCISSDAHHPSELNLGYQEAKETLIKAGYKSQYYYTQGIFVEEEI